MSAPPISATGPLRTITPRDHSTGTSEADLPFLFPDGPEEHAECRSHFPAPWVVERVRRWEVGGGKWEVRWEGLRGSESGCGVKRHLAARLGSVNRYVRRRMRFDNKCICIVETTVECVMDPLLAQLHIYIWFFLIKVANVHSQSVQVIVPFT